MVCCWPWSSASATERAAVDYQSFGHGAPNPNTHHQRHHQRQHHHPNVDAPRRVPAKPSFIRSPLPEVTIFAHNKTLPSWDVRVLVCGTNQPACAALAEWLTTRTDSPRELASPNSGQGTPTRRADNNNNKGRRRIAKVMALSKEGEGEGEDNVGEDSARGDEGEGGVERQLDDKLPKGHGLVVTTSLSLYAVAFTMWVPPRAKPDKAFLASFEATEGQAEGNLALVVAFDIGSIASFEWARHFLESHVPASLASSPQVLAGVCTPNTRVRQVPAEEASSVAREHGVRLVEVCCVGDGVAVAEILPGLDTTPDDLLQFLVNTSKQ